MEEVRVAGVRPVWGLPSPSPFCLKLETWLRFAGIPYTNIVLNGPPRSKTRKVPYLVRADGSTVADSNIIIEALAAERGIDLRRGQTGAEQARAHAVIRMIEESLYFVAVWERWLHADYWPTTRAGYFGQIPAGARALVAAAIRSKVRTTLDGQGISRHEPKQIAEIGARDIAALSAMLGERDYFMEERPGIVDACAYGSLANLLGFPHHTPLKQAVEAHSNLVAFCDRIRREYWNDGSAHGDSASLSEEKQKSA